MTRRMLINALRPEEVRVAIVSGKTLDNYQVEVSERGLTRGNIYRGKIAAIQPSLNAAFIDYGAERHGFLAIQDVVAEACYKTPPEKNGGRRRIDEVLERGRPIVVQVSKEAEGQKGAVLTTNLSLAGRYLVLTPFDDTRGVSRKVEDEDTRKELKKQAAKLDVPKGCGVIVRTNALDQNKTALNRDLSALVRLWKRVSTEARRGKGVKLLYSDQDLILQALRDHLDSSVEEVLVDDDGAYEKAAEYMRAFMPRGKTRLTRYSERAPLFSRFDLETQIERIYERTVELPSGGSLVIDRTEALTAIDVNSGKSTRASSQEETALHTNLEAAPEVARQLRLRDIGGLLVVDFIDMRAAKNRRKVEKAMRDAMKADKARSTVGRISANGLLEINRQRIQQALSLRTHRPCPTCAGTGRIASPEMVGLNLLRRIEARATGENLAKARIALHPELADAFQNGRRREIAALEEEFDIRVEIIAASHLHRPEQEIDWVERDPREKRKKPAPSSPKATVEAAHLVEPTPASKQERKGKEDKEEGREKDGASPGRSRRRRRRRRGKGEAEGDGDGQSPSRNAGKGRDETEEAPTAPAREPENGGNGGDEDPGGDDGAAGTRRRRRRSRRRRRRGGGEQESTAQS